jgi:hypothetical protein
MGILFSILFADFPYDDKRSHRKKTELCVDKDFDLGRWYCRITRAANPTYA